ncbi:hypothetical protein [Nonomuraea sp. NPDC050643]|uniref:hypothetical protein n=1 Tax=Nonomuraea sp. NPDC050643 TaxID=3155660 RepID=UPI0033E610CF
MYRFNGAHHKGYMKTVREEKRWEAEERNARTPKKRTRAYRESGTASSKQTASRKP